MKINIKFAELHNPLFLSGTNLQMKLDVEKRPLKLIYDRAEKELLVYFKDEVAIIPSSNVSSMTPFKDEVVKEKQQPFTTKPIKAQASTPHDHVFADEAGKKID